MGFEQQTRFRSCLPTVIAHVNLKYMSSTGAYAAGVIKYSTETSYSNVVSWHRKDALQLTRWHLQHARHFNHFLSPVVWEGEHSEREKGVSGNGIDTGSRTLGEKAPFNRLSVHVQGAG